MGLFKNRTWKDHTESLANYLPNGCIYDAKRIPSSNTYKYLRAIASELMRFYTLCEDVATEHEINVTQNLINEWESALGIPQSCFRHIREKTIEERRLHLLMTIHDLFAVSAEDFVNIASLLGYTVELEPARLHGSFPMAFPLYFFDSQKTVKFTMIIHLPPTQLPVGFPLEFPIKFITADNILIRCLFEQLKPAYVNTYYIFDLPPQVI